MDAQTQRARALRRDMTKEERRLWYDFLRGYPIRFLRQRPIDRYIVDFYCAKAKLAVELDGGQHFAPEGRQYDAERDRVLSEHGVAVLRIANSDVLKQFPAVCEQIDLAVRRRCGGKWPPFEKGAVSEDSIRKPAKRFRMEEEEAAGIIERCRNAAA